MGSSVAARRITDRDTPRLALASAMEDGGVEWALHLLSSGPDVRILVQSILSDRACCAIPGARTVHTYRRPERWCGESKDQNVVVPTQCAQHDLEGVFRGCKSSTHEPLSSASATSTLRAPQNNSAQTNLARPVPSRRMPEAQNTPLVTTWCESVVSEIWRRVQQLRGGAWTVPAAAIQCTCCDCKAPLQLRHIFEFDMEFTPYHAETSHHEIATRPALHGGGAHTCIWQVILVLQCDRSIRKMQTQSRPHSFKTLNTLKRRRGSTQIKSVLRSVSTFKRPSSSAL